MKFTMKKTVKFQGVFLIAVSVAFLMLSAFQQGRAWPADEGQDFFKAKCSACHGAYGSGNTPIGKSLKIRDLRSAEVQKESDGQLSEIIRKGKGKMPAAGKGLTDEQVHQVVAYLRDLGKKQK